MLYLHNSETHQLGQSAVEFGVILALLVGSAALLVAMFSGQV